MPLVGMMPDKDIFVHEFNGLLGKRLLEHVTLSHPLNIDCERQLLGQLKDSVGPFLANMSLVCCMHMLLNLCTQFLYQSGIRACSFCPLLSRTLTMNALGCTCMYVYLQTMFDNVVSENAVRLDEAFKVATSVALKNNRPPLVPRGTSNHNQSSKQNVAGIAKKSGAAAKQILMPSAKLCVLSLSSWPSHMLHLNQQRAETATLPSAGSCVATEQQHDGLPKPLQFCQKVATDFYREKFPHRVLRFHWDQTTVVLKAKFPETGTLEMHVSADQVRVSALFICMLLIAWVRVLALIYCSKSSDSWCLFSKPRCLLLRRFQATLLNVFRVGNIRNGISLADIAREFGFAYTPSAPKPTRLSVKAQANKRKHNDAGFRSVVGFQFSWQQALIEAVLKSLMTPADGATQPLVLAKDPRCPGRVSFSIPVNCRSCLLKKGKKR